MGNAAHHHTPRDHDDLLASKGPLDRVPNYDMRLIAELLNHRAKMQQLNHRVMVVEYADARTTLPIRQRTCMREVSQLLHEQGLLGGRGSGLWPLL